MIIMELGGHVLESLGGIGLLIGEVSERRSRAIELQEIGRVKGQFKAIKTVLAGALKTSKQVNERLYGNPDYTTPESITRAKAHMKGLEEELERLRDNQDDVAKALPYTVQFWGLIALVLGFCLQLIAMIVKDFG